MVVLCLAAWCQGCDNSGSAKDGSGSSKKLHVAVVANTADDFWSVVHLGCVAATRELGNVDLDFRVPANPTVASQQELLNSLVTDGVDGIAVSPIDAESQTNFLNRIASKTLLVCVDSDAADSKRVCYIGTDNMGAGQQAGDLLKAALPQGGKIVLFVSYLNAQNTKSRVEGIKSVLAGSNIQVVDILADGAKSTVAQKNAGDMLTKYPDLAGMACLNGYQGPAILTAVRSAGKNGKLKIVCFDAYSDTLEGIAAGDIYGTITQVPFNCGYQTVLRMGKCLRGDKTQLTKGKILLPSSKLTKDKVAEFRASRNALLLKAKAGPKLGH